MSALNARQINGQTNYLSGLGAEDSVARYYNERGCPVIGQRYRGKRGEIDLIVQDGDAVVFVEVKKARSHAAAAVRVTQAKMARLWGAAEEYLGGLTSGLLTECRFDVALVDGQGQVDIRENAFGLA